MGTQNCRIFPQPLQILYNWSFSYNPTTYAVQSEILGQSQHTTTKRPPMYAYVSFVVLCPLVFLTAIYYALLCSHIACYKSRPSHSALYSHHTEYKLCTSSICYFLCLSQHSNVLPLQGIELWFLGCRARTWSPYHAVFIHVVKTLLKKSEGLVHLLTDKLQGVCFYENSRNT